LLMLMHWLCDKLTNNTCRDSFAVQLLMQPITGEHNNVRNLVQLYIVAGFKIKMPPSQRHFKKYTHHYY
jgi:hypothetical protein